MSVREYIGARYVPVFADPLEWNASRTYEPLTIVLYQGNSYTSRQAVPTGIEITNTAYWAQTGNYNAQVEQYRQEVQALDTEIDNLFPVSVANGGTGASNAAGARAAIDAAQSNGASNTLYDAELAISENAADIASLQNSLSSFAMRSSSLNCSVQRLGISTISFQGFKFCNNLGIYFANFNAGYTTDGSFPYMDTPGCTIAFGVWKSSDQKSGTIIRGSNGTAWICGSAASALSQKNIDMALIVKQDW